MWHDGGDAECHATLGLTRRPIAPDGRLLAIEAVMPQRIADPAFAVDQDLTMMVVTGGRERTESEYGQLFAEGEIR